jgi:hypothetical protein
MSEVPAKTLKKLQTLAEMAAELREGEAFRITRLTMLKSLCSDAEAAAQFAQYLAKKSHQAMKTAQCPSHIELQNWQHYQRLAAKGVRGISKYLKQPSEEAESSLREQLSDIRSAQSQYKQGSWDRVRIIESRQLLVVETAVQCVLDPWASADLGYRLARNYAERYSPWYFHGLIPESAPMIEDIAEFWGRHFLGRGWRKRLAK